MKKTHTALAIITILIVCAVAVILFHPLRSSETRIRNRLLKKTPLGTPSTQVLEVVKNAFFAETDETPQYNSKWGARKTIYHPKNSDYVGSRNVQITVGTRSIKSVEMGSYLPIPLLPIKTYVYASWAFDDNDELIDIIIHKEADAP